jgi:hypothetical protein
MEDEPGVYRVWMPNGKTPGLAISRAFGDYCVKNFGLISVPDVTQRKLTNMDQFVILATDGVCILFPFIFQKGRIACRLISFVCNYSKKKPERKSI